MGHLGYDRKVILVSLYQSTKSAVRIGTQNEVSSWFDTLVGVLQGCVLLLFSVMLEVVMAIADSEVGGIVVSRSKLSILRFAADLAILVMDGVSYRSK